MKLVTRYGLSGIGGLALLSSGNWLRARRLIIGQPGKYLLGVLPNFAAAIAIVFVILSIWTDQNLPVNFRAARIRFLLSATISGIGLVVWEFMQRIGHKLVFDIHDILATAIGLCAAALLFQAITPKTIHDAGQTG